MLREHLLLKISHEISTWHSDYGTFGTRPCMKDYRLGQHHAEIVPVIRYNYLESADVAHLAEHMIFREII